MRIFSVLFISVSAIAATVPDLYIVQLDGDPAAIQSVRRGHRAHAADPEFRAGVSSLKRQHLRMRAALESNGAQVIGETTAVTNTMVVRITSDRAAGLASIPGVRTVHPVRLFYPNLDHALPLAKVPDAWNQIGGQGNAGLGIKIGIIDTGIDSSHPALNDPSLTPPSGFPIAGRASDSAYTNNKVIVARSYAINSDGTTAPALDTDGHGTGTSTVAAGAAVRGPTGPISGVAPKAFLGNYKVFPDNSGQGAQDDWILTAIDDAVADGMDVINLSLGTLIATRPSDDLLDLAVENAVAAGKIVTIAAGNSGSDPNTIGSPGTSPHAITVGSSWNDRDFAGSLQPAGGSPVAAYPGTGRNTSNPVIANLVDITQFDSSGQACDSLPPNSLQGSIAFIFRGICTFEVKINNAQRAGAIAVVVYTDAARPDAFTMSVGTATLPAASIGYQDGIALKQQMAGGSLPATLDFKVHSVSVNSNRLSTFSSRGPNTDSGIKPDLLAVGQPMITATLDSGYVLESGTSFSAPMVAGAAALLEAARPGLTATQYRSLLVNSGNPIIQNTGVPLPIQQAGAGFLNVLNSLLSNITTAPASLSFGAGAGTVDQTGALTITNVGSAPDTFSVLAQPIGDGPFPSLSSNSVQLNPGESQKIAVRLTGSALSPGSYQGYLQIQGTQNSVAAMVPYWYGVPSGAATHVTVLESPANGRPGSQQSFFVRPVDDQGLPVSDTPTVSVTSGSGTITSVQSIDSEIPGAFQIRVLLTPGANVFHVVSGSASADITIQSP